MIFMDFVHENHIGRNFSMQNTLKPSHSGSAVPELEGAPCSVSHENRMIPVISSPQCGGANGGKKEAKA